MATTPPPPHLSVNPLFAAPHTPPPRIQLNCRDSGTDSDNTLHEVTRCWTHAHAIMHNNKPAAESDLNAGKTKSAVNLCH